MYVFPSSTPVRAKYFVSYTHLDVYKRQGLACGKIVLSVAVMAIVTTAPVGAFGMDVLYKKLLNRDLTD